MKTNKQGSTNTETAQITQTPLATPRTGFNQNIMPTLSRDGETVFIFLPGDMTVSEPANRFKGLLELPYTRKAPAERNELKTRYGFHARIRIGLSPDRQWVTIYLPGNLGKIVNHVNAYKLNRPIVSKRAPPLLNPVRPGFLLSVSCQTYCSTQHTAASAFSAALP